MSAIQHAKTLVNAFHTALDLAPADEAADVCSAALAPGHRYGGVHPFNVICSPELVGTSVWAPMKNAMPVLQRRPDILFSGWHHMDQEAAIWVVSMGKFLGDFTNPWLGIPPTGKTTYVPYVAFYRIEEGAIVETVEFLDILSVLTQAGHNPCAGSQTAAHLMSPGPLTHDGILDVPQDPSASAASFTLTQGMLAELVEGGMTSPSDHLARWWHPDMNWHGPAGIGACLGLSGYQRGHTRPFADRLEFVDAFDETAATAEGNYSAFLWWPCLAMRNSGDYMGAPANGALAEMRVVDVYRRQGDKLAENWIFIDMLHFLLQQGIDLLSDIREQGDAEIPA